MANDSDVLLTFCNLHWDEIRHIESQRATLTNIIILVASGIVGLIVQQGLKKDFLTLSVMLILLGIYGMVTTLKLYERFKFVQTRLDKWYERINKLHPAAEFLDIKNSADAQHAINYPKLTKLRIHYLWLLLHAAISLFGIVLTILILIRQT